MKRLVATGAFCALAMSAFAQSAVDQQVVVPASKDGALQRVYVTPSDFQQYKGSYSLSNGKTLHLTRKATRLYAQVDQQATHEITPTGKGKFAALDGKMAMNIAWQDADTVSGTLTYVDEARTVAGVPQLITIALAGR